MQKKLFFIIFSVIFALVSFINAFLTLSEEEFFIGQDFSWLLSCVLAEFFLVFLCSFFLARSLSYIFLKPSEKIDLENLEHTPYPELKKMLEKIKLENKAFKTQFKHLKKKKQELQSLTQNMSDGLILISRTGEILSENLSVEKYFANLNLIHNILELKDSQFLELVLKYLKEFKKGKLKGEIRESFIFHYPNNLECKFVFSPIFLQRKKLKGMLIVLYGITELKRLQNLRKEFSANTTHELKIPLTSIMVSSEMTENKLVAPQDLPNFVDKIHLEFKRLLDMINETLKISFLDETQTLPFHRVNLKEVAERAYKCLELLANQHTIRFELDLKDAYILGTDELLGDLVFNLCDNGIKYNHKGGFIKVRLKKLSNFVELSIKDNGIGIPKKFQERVFGRFFYVDKSRSKKVDGSGLGPSVVKSVLKLHKASIELKSEPGKGSEFKMRFM